MMNGSIYGFLFLMWILILIGGGIAVTILGPITITGYGDFDPLINSIVKGGIAISLSFIWVFVLTKLKNLIFRKTFNF